MTTNREEVGAHVEGDDAMDMTPDAVPDDTTVFQGSGTAPRPSRSPLRRKTPLHRSSWRRAQPTSMGRAARRQADRNALAARRPLRALSPKRRATLRARRRCVAAVIERDGGCVFWALVHDFYCLNEDGIEDFTLPSWTRAWPDCGGPLTAHEPAHRRNVDPTDPKNAICLCAVHNTFVESMGDVAYEIGLLVRGNGLPLRHVRVIPKEAS